LYGIIKPFGDSFNYFELNSSKIQFLCTFHSSNIISSIDSTIQLCHYYFYSYTHHIGHCDRQAGCTFTPYQLHFLAIKLNWLDPAGGRVNFHIQENGYIPLTFQHIIPKNFVTSGK